MKLKVVEIQCPKCFSNAVGVRYNKNQYSFIKGIQCFNCRYFERLDLDEIKESLREKTLQLL